MKNNTFGFPSSEDPYHELDACPECHDADGHEGRWEYWTDEKIHKGYYCRLCLSMLKNEVSL